MKQCGAVRFVINQLFLGLAGGSKAERTQSCTRHEVGPTNPHHIVQCRDISAPITGTVAHNDKLRANFKSTTGGYKRYQLATHDIKRSSFNGTTSTQILEVVFDLEPPVHCSKDGSCKYEEQPPLGVYPDGTIVSLNCCLLMTCSLQQFKIYRV